MKMMLLLAAAVAAAAALVVWRTQHGAEVWHTTTDMPSR
ncbi:Uncharacterised protein [Mycolicibacterium vanbaalenii]|uniref:Uncharacterized protein n=1 Tax=Mycolicibacterium vanbaalenii TaxID=110539 RepID=A0A5S9QFJ4_MYCVN|nr:Uncharacterised protein [Mycolicibacterium vanbaalenii]